MTGLLSSLKAAARHLDGGLHGSYQAAGVRPAGCRQIERGAVIDGGADKGQPQRDVHALPEAVVFQHGQPLVVVHRQYGIRTFEHKRLEQCVRRIRAGEVYPFAAQVFERGDNGVGFFVSEVSAFAGVGIEPGD
ncbi:hypothetical protein ESCNG_90017 [Neisseria gonorrhoeae]|nr:hypothetical protein ESCNG_90017 [Neisseria gonorrhoeae]